MIPTTHIDHSYHYSFVHIHTLLSSSLFSLLYYSLLLVILYSIHLFHFDECSNHLSYAINSINSTHLLHHLSRFSHYQLDSHKYIEFLDCQTILDFLSIYSLFSIVENEWNDPYQLNSILNTLNTSNMNTSITVTNHQQITFPFVILYYRCMRFILFNDRIQFNNRMIDPFNSRNLFINSISIKYTPYHQTTINKYTTQYSHRILILFHIQPIQGCCISMIVF